jgi:hypothetical protein
MKNLFLILTIFGLNKAHALECEWWQSKVQSHQVRQHGRNGTPVSAHPRQEHCRENWKHAEKVVSNFKDSSPSSWTGKERFKAWRQREVIEVLEPIPHQ